jgi:MATE family multidrug resistance protein
VPETLPQPSGSPLKALLSLAWPVIISRSTQVVVGLTDAFFCAHLGESALASVTTGAMNSYALFIFPMGIAFIIASFSSQLTGKGDAQGARRYGWYGLALALGSQALMLALLPFLPKAVAFFHYQPEVSALMTSYLAIRLLSTGAAVGIEALGNYYSGIGNTAVLMRVNLFAMTLNVPLIWLLVDGHAGLPALGVAGAAWANVIATSSAFLAFLAYFLYQGRGFGKLGLSLKEFGRLLRFGTPAGLNWCFEFFAFLGFINVVVGGLGTVSLAGFMAVIQINSFSFMPAFGLGSAGAILVGQAIGAGRKDDVPALLALTFKACAVWMGLMGLIYLLVPKAVLGPLSPAGPSHETFLIVAAPMLMLSALWQFFDAAGITVGEVLRAAGDTAFAMWARGILAWGVFLPGSWLMVRKYGGHELTAASFLMLYLFLLATVLYARFRSGAWRRIVLVEEAPLV